MIKAIWIALAIAIGLIVLPSPTIEGEWFAYESEAYDEYLSDFDAMFDALEFKRAKNGASMIRRPGDKSFKFVAKGN